MARYFLDSSALVKAYRRERGTPRILALLDGPDALVISRLAAVEVSSAIARRGRAAGMPAHDVGIVLDELDREVTSTFEVIELDDSVMEQAVSLARRHAIRGADAVQLACALAARELEPQDELIVVSSDEELNVASTREGFSIIDPTVDA